MLEHTFTGARTKRDKLESWVGPKYDTAAAAERGMIKSIENETIPWRSHSGTPVGAFINERCECETSESGHLTKVSFFDEVSTWYVWKLVLLVPADPTCPECGSDSWEREETVSQTRSAGGTVTVHSLDGVVICADCRAEPDERDLQTLNDYFDNM